MSTDFSKNSQHMIPFHETAFLGAEYSLGTDEQTVLTKPVVAVGNFGNSPEN